MYEITYDDIKRSTFYPLIMNYFCSVHGFFELSSRHLINSLKNSDKEVIYQVINELEISESKKEEFRNNFNTTPLMAEQLLSFSGAVPDIVIEINDLSKQILKHKRLLYC
ncbi:hypothetical protein J1TS5_03720 [Paenibacillus macerans]|uniref:hypothetical protein n=1 Tax=Paenibacillus macerans TaxID=44252 RepID=UPI001B1FC11D|nr:hypothetical protein [Paenibacillus macerans]GIP08202.1 hypothetical protein J1TS5_03720 [Paenibacillus macerans]